MTITEIQNFLYEIDSPIGSDNSVLSDEQIFALADKIFMNKEILIELLNNGSGNE